MSQPLDRNCQHQPLVELDNEAGELHASTPFALPQNGENLSAYERNCFYLNQQGKSFINGSFASGADIDSDSRSVISADFDADGTLDLLVGSVGGGPLRLFKNRLPQEKCIKIELSGRESNASGLGSRIKITTKSGVIVRDLFPANGFMGQGPIMSNIGIGSAEIINIELTWPSGRTQRFDEIPDYDDLRLLFVEGDAKLHLQGSREIK